MKREDIAYFNSWEKCFKPASPAIVMQAILNGIWISSNKDPEDIYKVYPKLIQTSVGSAAYVDRQFSLCPFEFSFEDSETYEWKKVGNKPNYKGRLIKHYGRTWSLDCYEMRRIVSETGRRCAKKYKIRKEDILGLVSKNGFDDAKSYAEYMETRPDLPRPDAVPEAATRSATSVPQPSVVVAA